MRIGLQLTWLPFFWLFACVVGLRQQLVSPPEFQVEQAMLVETVLVDTVEKCQNAVAKLLEEKQVAIDIEGVDLSRAGEVCLIQMCGASSPAVYLFDIYTLKDHAFDEGGLKNLLESEQVTKVFYDVRADNDALYHLHGVEVRAAYDVQIMWHVKFQNPAEMHLQGLKRVFGEFLQQAQILSPAQMDAMERLKSEGQKLFAPHLGGSYEEWKKRPMSPMLLQYAAVDVNFLLDMKALWTPRDSKQAQLLDSVVREMSATRLKTFLGLPKEHALDNSMNKFRDFEIPDGFNDSGDVTQMVDIAFGQKGLLIGKGGATIRDLQASSGARIAWRGNTKALVIGQPVQVRDAVQKINWLIGSVEYQQPVAHVQVHH